MIDGLPIIDRAGHFQIHNPVFEFTYRNPTNVIHLYGYAGTIRIGANEHSFKPGDMTCIKSGTAYSICSDVPGKHWCIHYNEALNTAGKLLDIPSHFQFSANSLYYREQMQIISRLFNSQQDDHEHPIQMEARLRLKALLLALHSLSKLQPNQRRSKKNFSWGNLLDWIDDNLDKPLSMPQIAEQINLAPNTLTKKFKLAHKTTLSQYLLHRRIDKAKSLLATTTQTIYEVGSCVGIPDPQYFNKQFRKVAGVSPSRYREENQEFLSNIPIELATQDGSWQSP